MFDDPNGANAVPEDDHDNVSGGEPIYFDILPSELLEFESALAAEITTLGKLNRARVKACSLSLKGCSHRDIRKALIDVCVNGHDLDADVVEEAIMKGLVLAISPPSKAAAAKANGRTKGRSENDDEIQRLASLPELEYAQHRRHAAVELGVAVGVIDRAVKEARRAVASTADELPHWKVEPWADPVDGAALLDEIADFFSRYVILPKHGATALALWSMHSWMFDAGDISPYLVLKSPTKRCGKTTVLIILQYVTRKSELASNISPSAIFRYIEETQPTLLIDEADTFVNGSEEPVASSTAATRRQAHA